MSKKPKIILSIVALALFTPLLYLASEKVKRSQGFCISCHLDSSTPLHSEKHRAFMESNPVNLAGLHRSKIQKGFSCPDCHSGRSLKTRSVVFFLEAYNTFKQIVYSPKEPKQLDPGLMPDENCTVCHKSHASASKTFHNTKAHLPNIPAQCIDCHQSHPAGDGGYYFLVKERVTTACKKCHPRLSPAFTVVLRFR